MQLPKSMKEALEIDHATNTDFWWKAIIKEMLKVKVAWAAHDGHTLQEDHSGKVGHIS